MTSNSKKETDLGKLYELLLFHECFLSRSLPLIASENVTSMAVRAVMLSDVQHRYAEGRPGERVYSGCEYVDRVELEAVRLAKKLFGAEHVNVQPTSGSVANLSVYFCLTRPGDTIASLSVRDGGHITMNRVGLAGKLGLKVLNLPFDREEMNIDVDGSLKLILREKPKLVMLGASVILFPHPVREIAEVCEEVGANLVYDASHVLGLIAGKQFQNPLKEGALVVSASTHKTFPGPQHGLIMCRAELAEDVDQAVFPGTVSNHHLHCVAALAVACMEMLEFGESYAKQIVKNAKTLAESLASEGLSVVGERVGFTETHQVLIDVLRDGTGGLEAEKKLERAGILVNRNLLPWDGDRGRTFRDPSGIRIGVQEVTRIGMKEEEMKLIAEMIADVLLDRKAPEKVAESVSELRREFPANRIEYSFDSSSSYLAKKFVTKLLRL